MSAVIALAALATSSLAAMPANAAVGIHIGYGGAPPPGVPEGGGALVH